MADAPEAPVRDLRLILWIQALRAFLYGFGSVLLGTVLAAQGLSAAAVGGVFTAMLLGMALAHDSVGLVILWSCITSAGVGAAFAAIPNLIVGAVDKHETGEATGVNTVMRNIGSAVGAQVAGTIIATHVLASGLTANTGFTIAFLVSAIGAVIAGLSVLLIPGRCQQSAAEPDLQPALAA